MKSVDTIARVRRAFHVQGWSLKRISRELHVSRNTEVTVSLLRQPTQAPALSIAMPLTIRLL
jgi:orotate phosphoribosyltransferase-like protein